MSGKIGYNQNMKKISLLLSFAFIACGCVGMTYTDGDSAKPWIKIVSSKTDMTGNVTDVCYRFDLHFTPAEAITRLDTDGDCITQCCWYSQHRSVKLNFNNGFADELQKNAIAKKYDPDSLTIFVKYSPFLNLISGKADNKSVMDSDGTITLKYNEVKDQEHYLTMAKEEEKAENYDNVKAHEGSYMYKKDVPPEELAKTKYAEEQKQKAEAAEAAKEKMQEMPADEREQLLQEKLKYERKQAVLLLKRFYGQKIDSYIMSIDKAQRRKGLVLLANDRNWTTVKTGSPVYKVTCKVDGKLGSTQYNMKSYPIDCGVYVVNLDDQTVIANDNMARSIVNEEYKD